MADIWAFFEKISSERAQCKKCPKTISCKGGSTSGLIRHGLTHGFKAKETGRSSEDEQRQPKRSKPNNVKQSTIDTFAHKKPMNELVARLAAQDGFAISAITKSKFIRSSFVQRGYQLPLSKTTVMKLIHDYYVIAKQQTIQQLRDKIAELFFLSITLDEWTSTSNKKYLNVNVHFSDATFFNLGLVRIKGSFPADKIVTAVTSHLLSFDIDEGNVAAGTSDAAAVMEKFGRLVPYQHQLCYNHGLHLAVCDVIFRSAKICEDLSEESEESSDSDESDDSTNDASSGIAMPGLYKSARFGPILQQIRKICKMFRRSTIKNGVLQEKVVPRFGKQLQLILDVKTRWNSTEQMLARYIKLHPCVADALGELGDLAPVDASDLALAKDLFEALQPVRVVSERLGSREANLITAESSLNFLVAKLENLNTAISREILEAVKIRINQRRNVGLTTLIRFLNNPNDWDAASAFPLLSRANLFKFVKDNCVNMIKWPSNGEDSSNAAAANDFAEPKSLKEELTAFIEGQAGSSKQTATKASKSSIIQKELTLFELSGELTPELKSLFHALKSIKPTSTDSERIFAEAAGICTKKRNRLTDESVHILCFLKSFFKENE